MPKTRKTKSFTVTVVRTSYSSREINVEALTKAKAKELALELAGDLEFSEKDADYSVEHISEESPVTKKVITPYEELDFDTNAPKWPKGKVEPYEELDFDWNTKAKF
jgi:hypothetical protein